MSFYQDTSIGVDCNIIPVYASGNSAINELLTFETKITFRQFELHLSDIGGSGTLLIQLNSHLGSKFNTVILRQDMADITDIFWQLSKELYLLETDKIQFSWSNPNNRSWGIKAIYGYMGR